MSRMIATKMKTKWQKDTLLKLLPLPPDQSFNFMDRMITSFSTIAEKAVRTYVDELRKKYYEKLIDIEAGQTTETVHPTAALYELCFYLDYPFHEARSSVPIPILLPTLKQNCIQQQTKYKRNPLFYRAALWIIGQLENDWIKYQSFCRTNIVEVEREYRQTHRDSLLDELPEITFATLFSNRLYKMIPPSQKTDIALSYGSRIQSTRDYFRLFGTEEESIGAYSPIPYKTEEEKLIYTQLNLHQIAEHIQSVIEPAALRALFKHGIFGFRVELPGYQLRREELNTKLLLPLQTAMEDVLEPRQMTSANKRIWLLNSDVILAKYKFYTAQFNNLIKAIQMGTNRFIQQFQAISRQTPNPEQAQRFRIQLLAGYTSFYDITTKAMINRFEKEKKENTDEKKDEKSNNEPPLLLVLEQFFHWAEGYRRFMISKGVPEIIKHTTELQKAFSHPRYLFPLRTGEIQKLLLADFLPLINEIHKERISSLVSHRLYGESSRKLFVDQFEKRIAEAIHETADQFSKEIRKQWEDTIIKVYTEDGGMDNKIDHLVVDQSLKQLIQKCNEWATKKKLPADFPSVSRLLEAQEIAVCKVLTSQQSAIKKDPPQELIEQVKLVNLFNEASATAKKRYLEDGVAKMVKFWAASKGNTNPMEGRAIKEFYKLQQQRLLTDQSFQIRNNKTITDVLDTSAFELWRLVPSLLTLKTKEEKEDNPLQLISSGLHKTTTILDVIRSNELNLSYYSSKEDGRNRLKERLQAFQDKYEKEEEDSMSMVWIPYLIPFPIKTSSSSSSSASSSSTATAVSLVLSSQLSSSSSSSSTTAMMMIDSKHTASSLPSTAISSSTASAATPQTKNISIATDMYMRVALFLIEQYQSYTEKTIQITSTTTKQPQQKFVFSEWLFNSVEMLCQIALFVGRFVSSSSI